MSQGTAGFSLIEALIALAVLLLTLTLGLALFWQHPLVLKRLEQQGQAWDTVESTLEALRAGDLPLVDAELPLDSEGRLLRIDVEATPVRDLVEVSVEVQYQIRQRPFVRRSTTRIWQRQP
jgi:type II secretory pathway pseudopilin PulG